MFPPRVAHTGLSVVRVPTMWHGVCCLPERAQASSRGSSSGCCGRVSLCLAHLSNMFTLIPVPPAFCPPPTLSPPHIPCQTVSIHAIRLCTPTFTTRHALQIHWFSIFNSFLMVMFLTGLVAIILMRTLRKDYAR